MFYSITVFFFIYYKNIWLLQVGDVDNVDNIEGLNLQYAFVMILIVR